MKNLPIGVQTFEKLIQDGYLYVDKTAHIHRLITTGSTYFMSRPRRFGKSLLVSTLKAIFEGKRELFKGLAIDSLPYDWKKHPVLHFDFSSKKAESATDLKEWLSWRVQELAREHEVTLTRTAYDDRFNELLKGVGGGGTAVVLIDEYDKPILDRITEKETAAEMRDVLRGFYSTIKASDQYVRFVLLTGVSKFSKMSVFSGLNNLSDLTMDQRYADMLGYTQEELETCFSNRVDELAGSNGLGRLECLEKIRDWYNGYRFSVRDVRVYNPFSTLLLFDKQTFINHWFETGTPTFLINLIRERGFDVPAMERLRASQESFGAYEVETLALEPLLVQTGYLTILDYDKATDLYTLGYPNREVTHAFIEHLSGAFTGMGKERGAAEAYRLAEHLQRGDVESFFELMGAFLAGIPYDLHVPVERYYQTVFYLVFKLMGIRVACEVHTSKGRIDSIVEFDKAVWVFEFKLDGEAEAALKQIRDKGYAEKYKASGKTIHCVGVGFDQQKREIARWVVE